MSRYLQNTSKEWLIELFPSEVGLSEWQLSLYAAMLFLQERSVPYHRPKDGEKNTHSGSTTNKYHRSKRIMKAGTPPGSYCCGATMEAFMMAWQVYMAGFYDNDISAEQMEEMYRYFFVFEDENDRYVRGAAGGLLWLKEQCSFLDVGYSENPDDFPFGAFVQMSFEPDPYGEGHSAIAIGHGSYEGKPCLIVWSSNYGYEHVIEKSGSVYVVKDGEKQPSGHNIDFYLKDKTYDLESGPFKRKFYGAWIN